MQPAEEVASRLKFDQGDRRLLLAALLIVAASSLYVWYNYRAAFPQASLDLRYSRDQITAKAAEFLASQSISTSGFRNITLFDPDDEARLFLERENGLERANQLMQREVPVWRWRARWYKPPEKEEMRVWLSPDARLIGFEHEIAETAPGARLDQPTARRRAEQFLRLQTSQPHTLVEEQLQEKPNRYDYVFTWERDGFNVNGATHRRTVEIQGDRAGAYQEFLHIPEQWRRDFTSLRSKNQLYTQIAQAFYVPLILAAIIVHIQAIRRHLVPWRPLILLCAVVGALMVANQWNALPFFLDGVPTSTPISEGVAIGLLQALGAGVGVFFYVMLAAAPGETLYRASYPQMLSLPGSLTRRAIETREFFRASVAGYTLAAFHIAFVVAFYLIGRRFGVWSPQDVEYSDLLSTALPWLYPLTISLFAATSEEFWFRLFAIPLLEKILRLRWLAILVPAFIWGFLHANYPQQPAFIRGVEVGLIGIAAGVVMLRFGILATLVWHYTVDAVLIGTFLLSSQSWYFRLSGTLVAGAVLFPLAISLLLYRRNRGFLPSRELTNAALAPPRAPAAAGSPAELAPESVPVPLPPPEPLIPRRILYFTAAIALILGIALSPKIIGSFIRVSVDRTSAIAIASQALTARAIDPAQWRAVALFRPNLDVASAEYLRRSAEWQEAERILAERTLHGLWQVRFFRPQQKEEWYVYIDQSGRAFRTDHVLDEKAPGANLAPEAARAIAERRLRSAQKIPLDRYRLLESSQQRRDRRTDHFFVWEDAQFKVAQATSRVSLTVIGDEPSSFRKFLKLPEDWLRDFQRLRIGGFLAPALIGAVLLTALIAFIRRLAAHRFHWRFYLTLSIAALLVAAISRFNQLPAFYSGYDTAVPLANYLADAVISILIVTLLAAFAVLLGALALDIFLELALPGWQARLPKPTLARTACLGAILFGLPRAAAAISQWIPGDRRALPMFSLPGAASWAPAWDVLAAAFWSALIWCFTAGILIPLAIRLLSPRALMIWVMVAALAVALARGGGPALLAFYFIATLAAFALVIFLLLACPGALPDLAAAIFLLEALNGAATLLAQPASFYRFHGLFALALAMAAAAAWFVINNAWRSSGTHAAPTHSA